jgi:hypothetical protein
LGKAAMETHKMFEIIPGNETVSHGLKDSDRAVKTMMLIPRVGTCHLPKIHEVAKVSEMVARNHQITLTLMVKQLHLKGNSSDSPWQLGKEEDIHQVLFNHSPG